MLRIWFLGALTAAGALLAVSAAMSGSPGAAVAGLLIGLPAGYFLLRAIEAHSRGKPPDPRHRNDR